MNNKLTLTLEKEVIDRAKVYAAQEGRSLSDIVENYLNFLSITLIKEQSVILPE